MSGTPTPVEIPPFVASILNQYAAALRPAFGYLLISGIFSALLLPLLFMLICVSTSSTRRQPIFIINVVSIILGLLISILCIHNTVSGALSPTTGANGKEVFVYGVFFAWLPWITELVLIFRLIVVYHLSSSRQMASMIAFPVVMKLVRAGLIINFLIEFKKTTSPQTLQQFDILANVPKWIHESAWIVELLDNSYISGLFLWRLAATTHIFNGKSVGRDSAGQKDSFSNRLRGLFWIASTNFIFPVIFGIIEIAFLFQPSLQLVASQIYLVNIYVAVISTVLASVWAGTANFKEAISTMHLQGGGNVHSREKRSSKLESMAFAHNGRVTTIISEPPTNSRVTSTTEYSSDSPELGNSAESSERRIQQDGTDMV